MLLNTVVTNGYELAPSLSPDFKPNITLVKWWESPVSWFWNTKTKCQPKDLGRGDLIRLTPSLFEYKVHSVWKFSDFRDPKNEVRVNYTGQSFKNCSAYEARFDHSFVDSTQTVTAGVVCVDPVNAWMETSATFSEDKSKDFVGQFWGYDTNSLYFLNKGSPGNYRQAVFAVLDVISTDSHMVMRQQYLQKPILSLSTHANLDPPELGPFTVKYVDGTVDEASQEASDLYGNSVWNLGYAVLSAVALDLGGPEPDNNFFDQSALIPDLVPGHVPTSLPSSYYGSVVGEYQNWAQMLRAGLPSNITLGNLTGLPNDSVMVTNYLCPSYQLKQTGSFLSGVFVGTATMFMSIWALWAFGTAFIARRIREPCKSSLYRKEWSALIRILQVSHVLAIKLWMLSIKSLINAATSMGHLVRILPTYTAK
ncbi:hypothetical protein FRC10_002640 [Ceratobasidium sp. 414]|nr:hypothetical protein FRC10_002640 [Ceratobasidium sp. 414]